MYSISEACDTKSRQCLRFELKLKVNISNATPPLVPAEQFLPFLVVLKWLLSPGPLPKIRLM